MAFHYKFVNLSILGGGVAGLAAAHYATNLGLPFQLFEKSRRLGGNAATLEFEGFRFDTGAHRFHDKDPEVTHDVWELLGDELMPVDAPSRIHSNGAYVDFPLSPSNLVRNLPLSTLILAIGDLVRAHFPGMYSSGPAANFEEHAVRKYGRLLAEKFLLNYSAKLWGTSCSNLSVQVTGGRLKGLNLRGVLFDRIRPSRPKQHLDGSFLYPRRGIGSVADALAANAPPGSLQTDSHVSRVLHDDHRVTGLEINGSEVVETEEVVSTLPLPVLARLLSDDRSNGLQEQTARLKFRHVLIVAVFLQKDSVSKYATTYFPESRWSFTRIHEPRCRGPEMSPPDCTSLIAEIPCSDEDSFWQGSDSVVRDRVLAELQELGWVRKEEILGHTTFRMPNAYPVLTVEAEEALSELSSWFARFRNLHLLGRAGTFEYLHIHDLIRAGRDAVRTIATKSTRTEALAG